MITLQKGIDPITHCKINVETSVLDHCHITDLGDNKTAFVQDFLHCRAVLNRTSNAFEGRVTNYFMRCEYPIAEWIPRLRNLCLADRVAIEDIFYSVWKEPNRHVQFDSVVFNLSSFWQVDYSDFLEYPYRIKETHHV